MQGKISEKVRPSVIYLPKESRFDLGPTYHTNIG
jgi:hypothetical protein